MVYKVKGKRKATFMMHSYQPSSYTPKRMMLSTPHYSKAQKAPYLNLGFHSLGSLQSQAYTDHRSQQTLQMNRHKA